MATDVEIIVIGTVTDWKIVVEEPRIVEIETDVEMTVFVAVEKDVETLVTVVVFVSVVVDTWVVTLVIYDVGPGPVPGPVPERSCQQSFRRSSQIHFDEMVHNYHTAGTRRAVDDGRAS